MDDLKVFQRSARQCGYPRAEIYQVKNDVWAYRKWPDPDDNGGIVLWNPYTNDSQRWQCVVKLLENDGTLILCDMATPGEAHEWYRGAGEKLEAVSLRCPASEFPARALAELDRRENG